MFGCTTEVFVSVVHRCGANPWVLAVLAVLALGGGGAVGAALVDLLVMVAVVVGLVVVAAIVALVLVFRRQRRGAGVADLRIVDRGQVTGRVVPAVARSSDERIAAIAASAAAAAVAQMLTVPGVLPRGLVQPEPLRRQLP